VPVGEDSVLAAGRLRNWLESCPYRWLTVFDNADGAPPGNCLGSVHSYVLPTGTISLSHPHRCSQPGGTAENPTNPTNPTKAGQSPLLEAELALSKTRP